MKDRLGRILEDGDVVTFSPMNLMYPAFYILSNGCTKKRRICAPYTLGRETNEEEKAPVRTDRHQLCMMLRVDPFNPIRGSWHEHWGLSREAAVWLQYVLGLRLAIVRPDLDGDPGMIPTAEELMGQ